MKMKKNLWAALFAVFILVPPAAAFFADPYLDHTNEENRALAEKPVLNVAELETYPKNYEDYYNDHLPFRNLLIKANSFMKWKLFGESSSDQVVIGKDGWLFYDAQESMEDYKKQLLYSRKELKKVRNKLLDVQEYCEKQRIQFVLMIAPNKETVYPEYMPESIKIPKKERQNRADQLIEEMKDTRVNIVYPKEQLIEAKKEQLLYYPLDSHWNYLGGYIGAQALFEQLGIQKADLQELKLQEDPNPRVDLAGMLNLKSFMDPGKNKMPVEDGKVRVTPKQKDYQTVLSYESNADDTRKLFVIRDSFSMALFPYLSAGFQKYYTPKLEAYTPQMLEEEAPDILVLQIVERNLGALPDYQIINESEGK